MPQKASTVLPGFRLTLGYSVLYLSLIVFIPLSAVVFKSPGLLSGAFWDSAFSPRVIASYKLSFGMAFLAALINVVFGLILAWALVRYRFVGHRFVDALIDLPFAMPTAVAGIALSVIYDKNGLVGSVLLDVFGLKVAYTPLGILVALVFIGLPFVVRTVQPILEDLDPALEEAAQSLGASRFKTFRHVLLPTLFPALLTGFTLAFARAVGEYGSVIFIAGNIPMVSEITPLLIITRLEQFDYEGASAIALVMLVISFVLLLIINSLQAALSQKGTRAGS